MMAEREEYTKVNDPSVDSSLPSMNFVEVICKSSGKARRFASGTEAKFALNMINRKLDGKFPLATHIEAVKEGEEPISFGPNSVLVDYGHGWKLQSVTETQGEPSNVKSYGTTKERVSMLTMVRFRLLEKPKDEDFCLELSKSHTYDDVVERVAQKLGLDDPSKIRLTSHNCYSQQPKSHPIKYRAVDQLLDKVSDILYYEVLDISLPELQCMKTLKVAFYQSTKKESVVHNIRLPKQSTVGDVLNEIKTKVELSHSNAELRLLEIFYHKIYKIFQTTDEIENINDLYWTLRAEEVPEEEKNLGPQDRLIHVYHFTKETVQNQLRIRNSGEPFFLRIHKGETLADIKLRIQKKLLVPNEEFSKWKFVFVCLGRPEYLEDNDIVSSLFQRRYVYGGWEQYLGLEHSDTTPKSAFAANQVKVEMEM